MKRISPIRARPTDGPALLELKASLRSTQTALSHAFAAFDYTSDPELTESCIFEIRALQARINYLLRTMKEEEERSAAAAAGGGGKRKWV